jgi:hypothetical protein
VLKKCVPVGNGEVGAHHEHISIRIAGRDDPKGGMR